MELERQNRVEWRAATIRDPIERLKYLRQHGGLKKKERGARWMFWTRLEPRPRLAASVAAGAAILLVCGFTAWLPARSPARRLRPIAPPVESQGHAVSAPTGIWLVDNQADPETYSNGLRIENRFATGNVPRGPYRVFPREHPDLEHARWKDQPVGIVYHTTESQLAPFVADENRNLQRISVEVLNFVRHNHSYHFLIDRFGRVYRVVRELDVAYHAGNSVWGDESNVYVNLNGSFIGIAFETRTLPGEGLPTATPAQIDAARLLTEMLRGRFPIAASNCVTHAQVSVNPLNTRIGYHTDWADKFPFLQMGLTDNYAEAPASIYAFGFSYDPDFIESTGARLLPGLRLAEVQVRTGAARRRVSIEQYQALLKKNYKEIVAASRSGEPVQETTNEH